MARPASVNALVTLDELIPYLTDQEFPDYSEEQKQNFQLIINGVSEFFKSYTERNILVQSETDYIDGGLRCILKKYPTVAIAEIRDEIEDEAVDTDDYRLRPDTGFVFFDPPLIMGESRYTVSYTAGLAATVADVPEEWKLMCASAVTYMQNRDAANFTRAVEGVAIYPRALPPMVMEFLKKERDKKA